MKIVLFAAPGILGPHVFASLLKPRKGVELLVLPSTPHAVSKDDLLFIAKQFKIPSICPTNLRSESFLSQLQDLKPDLIVVASFDAKIPPAVLATARLGGVNLHPSLLPRYRGACPEFWAIRNGDKETGLTLHRLTDEFDAGDILSQQTVAIGPYETLGSLLYKFSQVGIKILSRYLEDLATGVETPEVKQDDSLITEAPLVNTTHLQINWTQSSQSIVNLIRASNPLGGAWTYFRGFHLKVWYATLVGDRQGEEGVFLVDEEKEKLFVNTNDGLIELCSIQWALYYIVDGWHFVKLANIKTGERLSFTPMG